LVVELSVWPVTGSGGVVGKRGAAPILKQPGGQASFAGAMRLPAEPGSAAFGLAKKVMPAKCQQNASKHTNPGVPCSMYYVLPDFVGMYSVPYIPHSDLEQDHCHLFFFFFFFEPPLLKCWGGENTWVCEGKPAMPEESGKSLD
jgi:hypothetical protein